MSDAEMSFRDEEDYISKYRRVLEHFDATKIGLTATPALHTTQIFGDPILIYSYREAVIDGYLIDHEPPVRIETALSRTGIGFKRGEELEVLDTGTGQIDLAHAPDDLNFAVDEFNKRVVTVPFNATVAKALADHIDPSLPGKTLIFAVSDAHADIVVDQVKKAMEESYGEIEDAAVKKITGSVDRVGTLIRSFRNDALPKIAVTVDLLTTGIDVPSIVNLVFLRRVNSRILYEQMIGRATRSCDEIEKETFRIFDAVDLYPHLQNLTQMKPVVVNPSITLEQLFRELAEAADDAYRREVRDQALAKLHRRVRRMPEDVRRRYEAEAGETPEATIARLKNAPLHEVSAWVKEHPGLGRILDWDPEGHGRLLPISHHPDALAEISHGYGGGVKPEDFLDGFTAFVRSNVNKIAALTVVVQRPRDLTRSQLRALKLELDGMGYSETALRTAWQDARNEDIAASIVGFIRQAAIGDPLVPYRERVQGAMRRILASRQWSDPQRRWLRRIGEQLEQEIVVDREALDQEPFRADGGFVRLNKVFGGTLEKQIAAVTLIDHHEVVLVDRRHLGGRGRKQHPPYEPLDGADMYPRLEIRVDVLELFEAENIGEGPDAHHPGCLEFAGGLIAERVAIDDEAYPAESLCRQQAIQQGDRQLRLAGAGRHGNQHCPLILVKRRLNRLDRPALIRPQGESEFERLGLQRGLGRFAIDLKPFPETLGRDPIHKRAAKVCRPAQIAEPDATLGLDLFEIGPAVRGEHERHPKPTPWTTRHRDIRRRRKSPRIPLRLIDCGRHILAPPFGLRERNALRIDEKRVVRRSARRRPLSNRHGAVFNRTRTQCVAQRLAIRLPSTIPQLLVDNGTRRHFVEIDRLRRLGRLLHHLLNCG
jgi:hypothetical protein